MEQATFAELEHDVKKRRTRRELFLEKMDKLIPWERLERRIEPLYPKAGRGRRPYPLGAMKPGQRRLLDKAGATEATEKHKASVRAKVGHPFLYVKRHFGYAKVRYRGLAKNTQRIALLLGFSNLIIAGRYAAG